MLLQQSGADQAKIWVVRKERDGKLRWRMMPIHASIIFVLLLTVLNEGWNPLIRIILLNILPRPEIKVNIHTAHLFQE